MRTRKVRATFLLQLVVLAVSVGLFVLVLMAATSSPLRIGTVTALLAFWFVGIEAGVLPALIEHVVTNRGFLGKVPARSAWFVDVEAEHRRETERLREATRDNPTLQ